MFIFIAGWSSWYLHHLWLVDLQNMFLVICDIPISFSYIQNKSMLGIGDRKTKKPILIGGYILFEY